MTLPASQPTHPLRLDASTRHHLWSSLNDIVENYLTTVQTHPANTIPSVETLRTQLEPFHFNQPNSADDVLQFVSQGLYQQVHTSHPRHFGLFNPAPTTMGIVADTLVAAFNPQVAVWTHTPFANEVERHVIRSIAERFGYDPVTADGVFCTGGAEANHTALLTALVQHFPKFATNGVRGLDAQPVFYISQQSHHSFLKAARFCGLGTNAVRSVPSDAKHKMDMQKLETYIQADKADGLAPFMVVVTGGTTNAGVLEPIQDVVDIAQKHKLWCHLDAAWGGAAALIPELRTLLAGSEHADSITFDTHKWLSVPMSAGLYLTKHPTILNQTCHMDADYMPNDSDNVAAHNGMSVKDPYTHSLQWSRRFIGLKVFMSLAVAGWDGYAQALRHQVAMGQLLREQLDNSGWVIENETPLPVVCFSHPQLEPSQLQHIVNTLITDGDMWLSTTRLDGKTDILRMCVTNFMTQHDDIVQAVANLNQVVHNL